MANRRVSDSQTHGDWPKKPEALRKGYNPPPVVAVEKPKPPPPPPPKKQNR